MAGVQWRRGNGEVVAAHSLDADLDFLLAVPPRNIVATVNLGCRLDLKTIALHARNAEYNPKVRPIPSVSLDCG